MLARLLGAASSSSSSSKPARASSLNGQPSSPQDEHEYTDVAFGQGQSSPTAYDAPPSSRPSFSQPQTSRGSFLGALDSGASAAAAQQAYPPLPAFSQPSSTNGYPPLRSTFARLRSVLQDQSPALLDSLGEPLAPTDPALASLLHAISPYYLPSAVFESYQIHDGQDAFASSVATSTGSSGLVWGLWWLSLDQVEQEWQFWRRFEHSGGIYGLQDQFSTTTKSSSKTRTRTHPYVEDDNVTENGQGSTMTTTTNFVDGNDQDANGARAPGQSSFPPGWVRAKYSHPGWLPLLTDRCGNYIGVDLDPPPPAAPSHSRTSSITSNSSRTDDNTTTSKSYGTRSYGQPGQVIAFGREIDEKVVLFPGDGHGGWGRFLASFVDDVERGEFAELVEARWTSRNGRGSVGGGSSRRRSHVNGWSSDDVEAGRQHVESDEDELDSPESEEWGVGDGVGERSYFDTDRYGAEGDDRAGTEKQTWKLRPEFKKWLREDGTGGVIGVIAERSRRKWKSLGVGSRQAAATMSTAGLPQKQQPTARPPLKVVVPESRQDDEPGPESAVTVKATSGRDDDLSTASVADGENQAQPDVVLSPPTPAAAAGTVDPFSAANHRRSTSVESKQSAEHSTTAGRRSSLHPSDGLMTHRERHQHQQQQQRRKRPPPPPPAAIGLPTVDDLDYGGPVSNSAQRATGSASRASLDGGAGLTTTTRSSFTSVRSGGSDASTLPFTRQGSTGSTTVNGDGVDSRLGQVEINGSRTALVGSGEGGGSALPSPDGDEQDERSKLDIVVDRSTTVI
ncbi:hypothetical protein ACM66B_000030 [Microbotryomycetes sp. NB124-2]